MVLARSTRLLAALICAPLLLQGCAAYRAYDHDPRYRAGVDRTAAHVERLHAQEMQRRQAAATAPRGSPGLRSVGSYQDHQRDLQAIQRRSSAAAHEARQRCLRNPSAYTRHAMGC